MYTTGIETVFKCCFQNGKTYKQMYAMKENLTRATVPHGVQACTNVSKIPDNKHLVCQKLQIISTPYIHVLYTLTIMAIQPTLLKPLIQPYLYGHLKGPGLWQAM